MFKSLDIWCRENNKEYLLDEWSHKNNITPTEISRGSGKKIKWVCSKCGYEWDACVYSRTINNYNCPCCSNKIIVPGINDFETWCKANQKEYLLKEWSKENDITPNIISRGSKKEIQWVCSKCGYEWKACVKERTGRNQNCPCCSHRIVVPGINDFETWCKANQKEYLLIEWSKKNDITPNEISRVSKKEIQWVCSKCGYEWDASVSVRANHNYNCPCCSNRICVSGVNDLETWCKNNNKEYLLEEWSKENTLKPNEIVYGSEKKIKWVCSKCGYEWDACVYSRTINNYNCPCCSNKIIVPGINDFETWCKANQKEYLLKEWSKENTLKPNEIVYGSGKKIKWVCSKCGREWSSKIVCRTIYNRNCTSCSRRLILNGVNDFETWCKNNNKEYLLKEWSKENKIAPNNVTYGSGEIIKWVCSKCGYKWNASIWSRTKKGSGCSLCANVIIIKDHNDLFSKYPDLVNEWCFEENYLLLSPYEVSAANQSLVWWKCKTCGEKYSMRIIERTTKEKRGQNPCPHCDGRIYKKIHFI